ncbi:MAG: GAF domain-containing protein [Cyclobacteriaceae bacterium]
MQAITKRLSGIFVALFFLSVAYAAYVLYLLPQKLSQSSPAVDLHVIEELSSVLNTTYLTIGVTLLLGLMTTTLLFINRRPSIAGSALSQASQEKTDRQQEKEQKMTEEEELVIDQEAIEEIVGSDENAEESFRQALSLVCKELEASQAAAYVARQDEEKRFIELFASYAYHVPEGEKVQFRFGEGLAGQVAKEGKLVNINAVPEGYLKVLSGLGSATPRHLIIIPVQEGDQLLAVVEIASFHPFKAAHEIAIKQVFDKLALKLSNVDNVSLEKAKR